MQAVWFAKKIANSTALYNQAKEREIMQKNIKYQGLLNNLLNIDPFDSSLYFKIDNENFFDVLQYFGKNIFNNILNSFRRSENKTVNRANVIDL